MNIELHPAFEKSYKKRIAKNKKLVNQFAGRLELFKQDPHSSLLKDHALVGSRKNFRSFSITGDIRVVYLQVTPDRVLLLDIGTHNQVY